MRAAPAGLYALQRSAAGALATEVGAYAHEARGAAVEDREARGVAVADQSDEALILRHLPLIQRIARWFMRRMPVSIRLEDLEAAGIIGLLQAVQQRDPARPEVFVAYARRRIEGAMLDEVRRQDAMPKDARGLSRRIIAAMAAVERRTGAADEEAVAAELGVSVTEYRWMLERTADVRLLSLEGTEQGKRAYSELADREPSALDNLLEAETCNRVADAIAALPERQRHILALYYLEEMNLKEIALAMNLSQARVTQLHSEAVHRVRSFLRHEERTDAVLDSSGAGRGR